MYNDVLTLINAGDYELADMLHKIDALWLRSYLTDAERDDLSQKARDGANPDNSLGPVLERVKNLEVNYADLLTRIEALEGAEPPVPPVDPEDFPEWKQPLGYADAYKKGDKVTYNGKNWVSTIDGNVWAPGVSGWEEYKAATV